MSDVINLILQNFDIKKMENNCNINDCEEKPELSILFKETQLKKQKNRDLAKIYICKKHLNKIEYLLKQMNKISIKEGKVVKTEIK